MDGELSKIYNEIEYLDNLYFTYYLLVIFFKVFFTVFCKF